MDHNIKLGPGHFISPSLHFWSHFVPKGKIITSYQSLHTMCTSCHVNFVSFYYILCGTSYNESFHIGIRVERTVVKNVEFECFAAVGKFLPKLESVTLLSM